VNEEASVPGAEELLGDAWRRLLAGARRRLRRTEGELTGSVTLAYPTGEELRVVERVAGRREFRRPVVTLRELDAALRRAYGAGLCRTLARLDGPGRVEDVRGALAAAMRCRYANEGWFASWLGGLTREGTVARLVREGRGDLPGWAAAVLDRLPARDLPLPVLAEWATGDAAALSGTPLARLVVRALVLWQGAAPPAGRADEGRIWRDAGVLPDDLACQVLVAGVRVREEHAVGRWLEEAATAGLSFRLTLQQLMAAPVTPSAGEIFVCASPAVLRAAAGLGTPIVCTEGRPSAACDRLLRAAEGARIHWRGDFDWPGVRTTAAATERYGATPWRMTAEDYASALVSRTDRLQGSRTATPWDARLADAMTREGYAAREEWLLPSLLADL
jgi:uncharacterized protein (TIGR02679 family)